MLPLAFVQAAPAVIVLVLDALMWVLFGHFVIAPWMDEQFGGKKPWWRKISLNPLAFIKGKVKKLIRRITSEMGQRFVMASPHAARWLRRQAQTLEQLSGVVVASNEAAYKAFGKLRNVTIPTLIEGALKPVRVTATNALALATGTATTLTAVSTQIALGLQALPWGAPIGLPNRVAAWMNSYEQLWDQFFKVAKPALVKATTVDIPLLWKEALAISQYVYGKLEPRVEALEVGFAEFKSFLSGLPAQTQAQLDKLINPAFFALAVGAAVAKFAPNLFCKNVTSTTQRICGQDEAMWAQLLAGTLLFALALDPRALARVAEGVTGTLDGVIRQTVLR